MQKFQTPHQSFRHYDSEGFNIPDTELSRSGDYNPKSKQDSTKIIAWVLITAIAALTGGGIYQLIKLITQ